MATLRSATDDVLGERERSQRTYIVRIVNLVSSRITVPEGGAADKVVVGCENITLKVAKPFGKHMLPRIMKAASCYLHGLCPGPALFCSLPVPPKAPDEWRC